MAKSKFLQEPDRGLLHFCTYLLLNKRRQLKQSRNRNHGKHILQATFEELEQYKVTNKLRLR